MLDERDAARLRAGLAGGRGGVGLVLRTGDGDPDLTRSFEAFAREVRAASGDAVEVRTADATGLPATPALTVTDGHRANVHYLALPEGMESGPFVDLLIDLDSDAQPSQAPWAGALAAIDRPAEVLVFVSAACPHCAHTVRSAHQVARAHSDVTTVIVDAQRFPGLAERYQVTSVPLTLVDRGLSVTGPVAPQDLAALIAGRNEAEHGVRVLLSLLDTNRVDDAVMRVLEQDGATALGFAWTNSSMTTRLGLMLVAEQVLEETPRSLDPALPALLDALGSPDASLRGDTADLLGQIRAPSTLPALEALLADPHPDVVEIATEAIEAIRGGA